MKIAVVMNLDWPLKRYHKLFAGIKEYAKSHTDWVVSWDPFPEIQLAKLNTYYAGIIGRCEFETLKVAEKLNVPVVNTWASNEVKGLTSVLPDYEKAGFLAAATMAKRGYTNFVTVNYRSGKVAKSFIKGMSSAISSHGYQLKKYWIPRDIEKNKEHWEKFHERFSAWSKTWDFPVAIITSICDIGPKLSCLCHEEGLEIPKNVAILSSDNDIAYCEGFSPTISSVNIDYFDVGYQAARVLDCKIKNKPLKEELTLIPPTEVVYRESTNYYAVDDSVVKKAMTFISDNYHKNIQIDDVVRNFALSRRSLEKRFKDAVGHTVFEEISRLRIETMKHLLLQTDGSVKVLSQKAGFSNGQHMRRAFKQHTGYTPKEFRRINKLLS